MGDEHETKISRNQYTQYLHCQGGRTGPSNLHIICREMDNMPAIRPSLVRVSQREVERWTSQRTQRKDHHHPCHNGRA